MKTKRLTPMAITLIYGVISSLWILFSDKLIMGLFSDPSQINFASTFKGWLFVAVTCGLLYSIIKNNIDNQSVNVAEQVAESVRLPASQLPLIFIALALIVPLIGVAFVKIQTPQIEREAYSNLQAIARLKAEQIENWLIERHGDSKELKASVALDPHLYKLIQSHADKQEAQVILARFQNLRDNYAYNSILLVDHQNRVLLSQGANLAVTPLVRDLVAQSMRSKQVQFSKLFRDETGKVQLDWVVPVLVSDAEGEHAVAAIILSAVADQFLYPLIQTWPTASASAETLLIRRDGQFVEYLNGLRHYHRPALTLRLPVNNLTLPAAVAVNAVGSGTMNGKDYRGVDVLAAYRPVAGTDWHIVAKVDRAEVMAPLWHTLYWIGLMAFAAMASIMLALMLLWRQQRKTQRMAMLALKSKDDQLLITLADNSTDAIYVKDLEGRYLLVNRETVRVLAKTAEQILGQDDTATFPAEEAAMVRANDLRVIAGNQIITHEETLTTADGERTYLATKGPMRDGDGLVIGLFGISRDITERKQAENTLRQSEERLQLVLRGSGDAPWDWNLESGDLYYSPRWWAMLGYAVDELPTGASLWEHIVHPDDQLRVDQAFDNVIKSKSDTYDIEFRLQHKDGHYVPVLSRGFIVRDANGKPVRVSGTNTDLTERRLAEAKLNESELRYRLLIETANDAIVVAQGNSLKFVNQKALELTGYTRDELISLPFMEFIYDDDRILMRNNFQKRLDGEAVEQRYQIRILTKSKQVRWVEMSGATIEWEGHPAIFNFVTDITERKQAEEKLQLSASVFSHAREGIIITDANRKIIEVNDAFTRITGFSRDDALGKSPSILSSGRHEKEFYDAMWDDLNKNGHWYGEVWNRRKDGEIYAEILTISAVQDAQGVVHQYVALFSDITTLKEHESQLEHIAHFDTLTGLPNRVLLADRLRQGMTQTQRREQRLAVVFLDIDAFKIINDTHGHAAGDQLLKTVANRMKMALREGDTLARIGGDEFVAVLLDLDNTDASEPMLSRLIEAAAQPVNVDGLVLQVTASLGVTFYPQADDVDADQLLRQADQAMYLAKQGGKNRYQIFDAEQDRNVRGHHENLDRIRHALTDREFVLYYQPKVNMRNGTVIGVEALIRWKHPEKGLLPPVVFLPLIEEHQLAIEVGEWVINAALMQIGLWQATGLNIPVSVNIGAIQLQQVHFVERLREILAAHPNVKPGCLELEILETSALEDVTQVSRIIKACHEMQVDFALDDFGTGYSSLTYLKQLPVTLLKIDQSFVRDMLDDPDDLAILEGVIGLAKAFHREVIAEGVETIEHGAILLQLGCELAQGYGIASPMPAQDFPAWLAAWKPDQAWVDQAVMSGDDLSLVYAAVDHRAWISAITRYINGEREMPPPLDCHQCRFGKWLDSELLTSHLEPSAYQAVDLLHQQVHTMAAALLALKHSGRNSEALARLRELYALRDDLLEKLKRLKN